VAQPPLLTQEGNSDTRNDPDGGPDAEDVGGPAGSKEAAKRRTEVIRTVGPTLNRCAQEK